MLDLEDSDEERAARLRETYRLMSLQDLRGAEFLRLLYLAHTEGLLAELMQAAGCCSRPMAYLRYASVALGSDLIRSRSQSIRMICLGFHRLRDAFVCALPRWTSRQYK